MYDAALVNSIRTALLAFCADRQSDKVKYRPTSSTISYLAVASSDRQTTHYSGRPSSRLISLWRLRRASINGELFSAPRGENVHRSKCIGSATTLSPHKSPTNGPVAPSILMMPISSRLTLAVMASRRRDVILYRPCPERLVLICGCDPFLIYQATCSAVRNQGLSIDYCFSHHRRPCRPVH